MSVAPYHVEVAATQHLYVGRASIAGDARHRCDDDLLKYLYARRLDHAFVDPLEVVDVADLRRLGHPATVLKSLPAIVSDCVTRVLSQPAEHEEAGY